MLVLTRKSGEEIFIDEGKIEIKILYVRKRTVAVAIRAPGLTIDRKEIFLKKQAAKLEGKEGGK